MGDREDIRREVMTQLRAEDHHTWRDWLLYSTALALIAADALFWLAHQ